MKKNLFTPPHCPNPQCSQYHHPDIGEPWFVRRGEKTYNPIPGREVKKVQQYFCKHCERSFSQATFEPGYYDKVPTDYDRIIQTARSDITLKEWACLLKLSTGVLSRRLFKVIEILVRECEQSERGRLRINQEFVEDCRAGLEEKGRAYGMLRDLIVELKKVLAMMKNLRRCFPTRLRSPLSIDLLKAIGVWSYIISKGCVYKPRYPLYS